MFMCQEENDQNKCFTIPLSMPKKIELCNVDCMTNVTLLACAIRGMLTVTKRKYKE